jgi:hypothetical protein
VNHFGSGDISLLGHNTGNRQGLVPVLVNINIGIAAISQRFLESIYGGLVVGAILNRYPDIGRIVGPISLLGAVAEILIDDGVNVIVVWNPVAEGVVTGDD